jgi:hypothetical protein
LTGARITIRAILILAILAAAAPAHADTVRCTAVEGRPTLALEVTITGGARDAATVTRLDADLGDFTISTAGNPPERIAAQESGDGRLSVELADPEDIWIVLRLRLVRDVAYQRLQADEADENPRSVVAGTLSVLGNGVWPVTCEGW